jgi:hypothetical protein
MSKPHFIATIDLGYVAIDIETDSNNLGELMVEIRASGHSLRLTREGALMLADSLKAAANAK